SSAWRPSSSAADRSLGSSHRISLQSPSSSSLNVFGVSSRALSCCVSPVSGSSPTPRLFSSQAPPTTFASSCGQLPRTSVGPSAQYVSAGTVPAVSYVQAPTAHAASGPSSPSFMRRTQPVQLQVPEQT
ncbi:unnamed protein product, partial [Polarella glacialis]